MGNLKKNFMYQTLYQILAIVLPLISAPYVARVLGAENSGIYSYTNVIANYFVVFGMLGLEQYGNRCIAKTRDDFEKMSITFSELFCVHAIVSFAVILIYVVYILIGVNEYRSVFFIQLFYVVSVLFDVNWFFFGIEKFKLTVVRNSIIKLASFISIFVFVTEKSDLGIYTFIMSFSTLISQLALIPMLRKFVSLKKVTISGMKKHVKPMLILFVAVIAANLNRMIDKVMIGWTGRMYDLGCYDYADRIIRIPLSLIAAFGTVMLSKMSNLVAKNQSKETDRLLDVSACLILMLSFAMGFGIAAIAPEFVIWYLGTEYRETTILLLVLAGTIPLVGWNNFVRTQMLIPKEMDSIYTKAVCAGAIVNIMVNGLLINLMSARGAAIATVVSYFVISFIQTISLVKTTKIKDYLSYIMYPMVAGGIMYMLVRLTSRITTKMIVSLGVEIITGMVTYGILMLIYLKIKRPDILQLLIRGKKKR